MVAVAAPLENVAVRMRYHVLARSLPPCQKPSAATLLIARLLGSPPPSVVYPRPLTASRPCAPSVAPVKRYRPPLPVTGVEAPPRWPHPPPKPPPVVDRFRLM